MEMKKKLLLILIVYPLALLSQSRQDLEKKRLENEAEIRYTNELILSTEKNKKASYNKLLLIDSKISNRKEIINSIEKELEFINSNIIINEELIETLTTDLEKLKEEYARIVYYSYLSRNKATKIMFVLASENFNVAFKRIKYYKQYSDYRKKQALSIVNTKTKLSNELANLELLKQEKYNLLDDKKLENKKLLSEKQQKDKEVKLLSGKEKELKKKLKIQYDLSEKLKKEIQRIIEEEAKKAAELLKKKNNGLFQMTPDEMKLADVFQKNQNKLPWPTAYGTITGFYGEQPHPFLSGIKIRNDGIDISTNEGAIARSVYEGTVTSVFFMLGFHKTVIIRHGNYCTVYSNLKEVFVKQGDKVTTKQNIGVVYTESDSDHKTVLQFQIWKEKEKLNPVDWLAKVKNG